MNGKNTLQSRLDHEKVAYNTGLLYLNRSNGIHQQCFFLTPGWLAGWWPWPFWPMSCFESSAETKMEPGGFDGFSKGQLWIDWGRWMKMVWWCVMYIFYYILRLFCWFFTAIVFMWKFSQNKVMWSRLIFRSKLPVEIPWWKCQKRAEKVYVPVYDHVTDDAIHLYLYLDHSIYIYKYDYMYMHAHVYRTISHFIVVVCRDMWLGPCIDRYH